MPIFQKPLGWVQRYFYNVEGGNIPFPAPVLPVSYDFPLEYKPISVSGTTAVGTVSFDIFVPGQERHGKVIHLSISANPGTFPATDNFRIRIVDPAGNASELALQTGLATGYYPLICSVLGALGPPTQFVGVPIPVYIPSGWKLAGAATSVAGGTPFLVTGALWDRLKSYPVSAP